MERKPENCPNCGSTSIADIRYGLPAFGPELDYARAEGHVVLGGCIVSEGQPRWYCHACGAWLGASAKWREEQAAIERDCAEGAERERREREDRERRGCGDDGDCPNCGFCYAFDGALCSHCGWTG
jgi:hypothetical protein